MSFILKTLQHIGLNIASVGMTVLDRKDTISQEEREKIFKIIENLHNGLNTLQDVLGWKCDDCETLENVDYIREPYEWEINSVEEWMHLCNRCYHLRCEEI